MIAEGSPGRPWDEPGWSERVSRWIVDVLDARGVRVTGPIERERIRFWSILLTVPTDAGRFWFKQNCPRQAFEARLVQGLRPVVGDLIAEVAAVEVDEGWLLTPDQGASVLHTEAARDPGTYAELMRAWGLLQRRLIAAPLDLPALGVTRMDPASAEAFLLDQIADRVSRPTTDVGRMDEATAERLRGLGPRLAEWVDTVGATGLPLTLEHADLHLNNVFTDAAGRLRVFDFSDAVVGYPLCTLLVPLRMIGRGEAGLDPDPVGAARTVEAYLEVFSDLAPLRELRAAVPAALELAKLHRYESWQRTLVGADPASYAEFGNAPTTWLSMLGEDPLA